MRSSGEGGPAMVGAVVGDSGDGGWGQWWAAVGSGGWRGLNNHNG